MSGVPSEDVHDPHLSQHEYLYTVLNLPTSASKEEIRDRYRQLSLVFHPDKQHGKPTQDTALRRFLDVQKAYEVLSDPVTRQAYDLYGLAGVRRARECALAGLSPAQVASALDLQKADDDWHKSQAVLHTAGTLSLGIDARSLLAPVADPAFAAVRLSGVRVKNTLTKSVGERLVLELAGGARVGPVGGLASPGARNVDAALRYTPARHVSLSASTGLFARSLTLGAGWDSGDSACSLKAFFAPALANGFARLGSTARAPLARLPPVTLRMQRRLWPRGRTHGVFEVSTHAALPSFTFALTSQRRLHLLTSIDGGAEEGVPSGSGMGQAVVQWSAGASVLGVLPTLFAECALALGELGVRLSARLEAGLQAHAGVLGVAWAGARGEVGVDVGVGSGGVFLKLNAVYMNQELHIPLVLSSELDSTAALVSTVLPATLAALAYALVLRPQRRRARLAFLRAARGEVPSDVVRAAQETVALLRETARRHMEAEAARDGLVILDARYGVDEVDEDDAGGLEADVTIALQALVAGSQVYVPGGRSKAGLQGFYDPLPAARKTLRVRYTFRGRAHYAEVPDYGAVVLPLEEHRVR